MKNRVRFWIWHPNSGLVKITIEEGKPIVFRGGQKNGYHGWQEQYYWWTERYWLEDDVVYVEYEDHSRDYVKCVCRKGDLHHFKAIRDILPDGTKIYEEGIRLPKWESVEERQGNAISLK
ncbi:MAG: hypothetical protein DRN07_04415 [Thermoplasmata archaeon]|nr:MAG: hypothetical protein DRN07_04415 [Thermoplasmata archaeon]